MDTFNSQDTAIIIGMVVVYIVITTWMSLRLRSKTSEQYMVAARTMPAFVVGILMMSEFIGAKSTVGTAQAAFEAFEAYHRPCDSPTACYLVGGTFLFCSFTG